MTLPAQFVEHGYTRLEMQGLHLRKVLRALIRIRRNSGNSIGDPAALTAVVVEIAAAIIGRRLNAKAVENLCVYLDIDPDAATLGRLTDKAVREVSTGQFQLTPSRVIGKLLDLTAAERQAVADLLRLKRVFIEPVDHAEDVRRRKRESAKRRRRETSGSLPRESCAAGAARLGVSKATLCRRGKRDPETEMWMIPMEPSSGQKMSPDMRQKTWMIPGRETENVDDPLSTEIVHKSVSGAAVPSPAPIPGRKRTA